MDQTYSITELERLTGLNRRTIHFYTKGKIIPPPDGFGGGAKYSEVHRIRLLMIKQLQRSHIKLSGIKETLNAMSIEQMTSILEKAKAGDPEWDQDSLGNWIGGESEQMLIESEPSMGPPKENVVNKSFSFLKIGQDREPIQRNQKPQDKNFSYLRELKRSPVLNDTSWRRFQILDGVEINIRSDIMNKYGSIILRWIEYLKKYI